MLDRFQTAIHQSSDTAADKARVFDNTVTLNRVRAQQMPAFGAGPMQVIETGQSSVLGFTRSSDKQKVLVLANFSEEAKTIGPDRLSIDGMPAVLIDQLSQDGAQPQALESGIELAPYQCMWLTPSAPRRTEA